MSAIALLRPQTIRSRRSGQGYIVTGGRNQDASLAARVSAGEESALETLYRTHGGAVRSLARRVLRDETLAEDIVQEVFVSFWRNPERYDPGRGALRTYLLTIAHRRAVDLVRSEQARTRREDTSLPSIQSIDLEEEVWVRSQSEAVRQAVAALDDGERQAISLAYFGGLTYVEVAKRLDQPEGTVKSRIRSGMKKLSATLTEGVP